MNKNQEAATRASFLCVAHHSLEAITLRLDVRLKAAGLAKSLVSVGKRKVSLRTGTINQL